MVRVATFWVTQSAHFQLRPNKVTLPSCFSSHSVKKCPFLRIFSSYFFCILRGFLFFILLFQMFPKQNAELLLTVQSSKMLFYALLIKCMLNKLHRHELLYCWLWVLCFILFFNPHWLILKEKYRRKNIDVRQKYWLCASCTCQTRK